MATTVPASLPAPRNEPVRSYAPGSPERTSLRTTLRDMAQTRRPLPMVIGGRERGAGDGNGALPVRAPHDHGTVLGDTYQATPQDVGDAVDAALGAWRGWAHTPFESRAAVFLRAAGLLT